MVSIIKINRKVCTVDWSERRRQEKKDNRIGDVNKKIMMATTVLPGSTSSASNK